MQLKEFGNEYDLEIEIVGQQAEAECSGESQEENQRQIVLPFLPSERDLYEWVKSQEDMMGYIKELIRDDMEWRKF